jgi:hypothetical protein
MANPTARRRAMSAALKDSKRPVDGYAMPHPPRPEVPARQAWGRVPLSALALLALFLAAGPIGLALSHDRPRPTRPGNTLGDVARKAGCRLHEYESGRVTNPPITGRLMEQAIATDGSYIGRSAPSLDATTHSLLHGRVLIQYRPGLAKREVRALDQLVKGDPRSRSRLREPDRHAGTGRGHRLPEPAHLSSRRRQHPARAPRLPRPAARIWQRDLITGRQTRPRIRSDREGAEYGSGAGTARRGAGGICLEGRLVTRSGLYPGVPSRSHLRARCWSCRSCTPGSQSLPYADRPSRGSLRTSPSRKACTYARSWSIRANT